MAVSLYNSKRGLYERYVIQKRGIVEMAKEASCSHMTIQRALVKYGILK